MEIKKKQIIQCDISNKKTKEVIYCTSLKDKTKAYFYYLDSGCKDCLQQGLGMLSHSSKRSRFNFSFKKFSRQELEYLTHIDNVNHVAIGCRRLKNSGYPGMGVGRYIRLPAKPETAEIAITILDAYQNKGIGTLLFCLLADSALKKGIRHFASYVQSDNEPMLALLQKFNFKIKNKGQSLLYLEASIIDGKEKIFKFLKNNAL
jgi:RimJ/RimL family protein N-acetyltransferase